MRKKDESLCHIVEDPVVHLLSRRLPAVNPAHPLRDVACALVAVLLHPLDPLGIEKLCPNDPPNFLGKSPHWKVSAVVLFVVDTSGPMGAIRRMEAAKGAVLSMLTDSYQKRDKVGMVAFRGDDADLLFPPSFSVDLAMKCLNELPTGGRTPLSAGLSKGLITLQSEIRKDAETKPILVLISDGRANVSQGGKIKLRAAHPALKDGVSVTLRAPEVKKSPWNSSHHPTALFSHQTSKYLGADSRAFAINSAPTSISLRLKTSTGEWMYLVATLTAPV